MLTLLSILGCTPKTTPPPTAVVDPLAYGITDACNTPGGDFSDFGTNGGVVLVHGDGAAELEMATLMQGYYSDLWGPIELVAGSALTEAQKSRALVVIGGFDANPLLAELQGNLPLLFDTDGFVFGGYRWDEADDGIALIHPNPFNPNRNLLLYVGNTVVGANSTLSVPTGGRDFHVVRGTGSLAMEGRFCRDGDSWTWFERRADDFRGPLDAFRESLTSVTSVNHIFHYQLGSSFEADVDWMPDWQEDRYQGILDLLEVSSVDEPIHWYLYETNELKGQMTGNNGNAHAVPSRYEVHAVYGPQLRAVGAHEDVHVVQHHRLGATQYTVLGEGMAVVVDGVWQGTPLEEWAATHLADGDLPGLQDMIDDFWGAGGGSNLGYGGSGAFNAFIVETYGVDVLKELYVSADLPADLLTATGRSVAELEADWHATLLAP